MVGGPERRRSLDMMKDEPPTSKPLPATCCHCPLGTCEATAASGKSTRIDKVTNHCTESRQVQLNMHSKQQPRCTIQQRQAYRLSPRAPPACKASQKRVVQHCRLQSIHMNTVQFGFYVPHKQCRPRHPSPLVPNPSLGSRTGFW